MSIQFAVVTKVPDPTKENGNLCTPLLWLDPEREVNPAEASALADLQAAAILNLKASAFGVGEVLILNADGREVAGHMRKPSKWDVEIEQFARLDEALVRAGEVSNS